MRDRNLKNIFNYSISRGDTQKDCERRYFYQYYFHWNGWLVRKDLNNELDNSFNPRELGTDVRKQLAYTFKKSTGFYLYVGNKIHSQLEKFLKLLDSNQYLKPNSSAAFVAAAVKNFERELTEIVKNQKEESFLAKPKDHVFFVEYLNSAQFSHGYPGILPPNWTRFVKDATELYEINLKAFFSQKLYSGLNELHKRAEVFDVEPSYRYVYEFKRGDQKYEIPVLIRPDLLTISDGVMSIFDWKTGSSRNIKFFQLRFYAYMLKKMYEEGKIFKGETIDTTKLKIYCLKESKPLFETYEEESLDLDTLHDDFVNMISVTDDGLDMNTIDDGREEEFSIKTNSGKFGCRACPFLKICPGTAEKLKFV